MIARKLTLADAQAWIEKELNGYTPGDKEPPHRILHGEIRAWNPSLGNWIPVIMHDSGAVKMLSECFAGQPVGKLEDLTKQDGEFFYFRLHMRSKRG